MVADKPVEIHGLRDLQRELRGINRGLVREVGNANREAGEFVRGRALMTARSLGGVHAKAAQAGMRSSRAARAVKIVLDGVKVPYVLGAEFGARRWKQFPSWRGNQWEPDRQAGVGYFLHPTVRATRDEFVAVYARKIDKLVRRAFPDGGR